jgi:hypothetical protein
MKLFNITLRIDPETYTPQYTFEGIVGVEEVMDGSALLGTEFFNIIGQEFLDQLDQGVATFRAALVQNKESV